MLRTLFLFSFSLLVFSCTKKSTVERLPFYNSPDFTPQFYSDLTRAYSQTPHTLPAFNLMDDRGILFTRDSLLGKIHVASFIFTQCGSICPTMVENMKALEPQIQQKDFLLVSYSVTPWIDSVPVLNKYRKERGLNWPNWKLITGGTSEIYDLARKGYFAEEDLGFTKDSTDFLHTEHLVLMDDSLRIRGVYNGTLALEIQQLSRDIDLLRREGSED